MLNVEDIYAILENLNEDKLNSTINLLVKNKDMDINARNPENSTLLIIACHTNNDKIAIELIKHGYDVNAKNKYDTTPLHNAVKNKNEKLTMLLIEKNADVNAKNEDGETPLHYAVKFAPSCTNIPLYNDADDAIKYMNLVKLLIKNGADINAKDKNGKTPLHLAAKNEDVEFIIELIKNGADINAKDKNGKTPFIMVNIWKNNDHNKMKVLDFIQSYKLEEKPNTLILANEQKPIETKPIETKPIETKPKTKLVDLFRYFADSDIEFHHKDKTIFINVADLQ